MLLAVVHVWICFKIPRLQTKICTHRFPITCTQVMLFGSLKHCRHLHACELEPRAAVSRSSEILFSRPPALGKVLGGKVLCAMLHSIAHGHSQCYALRAKTLWHSQCPACTLCACLSSKTPLTLGCAVKRVRAPCDCTLQFTFIRKYFGMMFLKYIA